LQLRITGASVAQIARQVDLPEDRVTVGAATWLAVAAC